MRKTFLAVALAVVMLGGAVPVVSLAAETKTHAVYYYAVANNHYYIIYRNPYMYTTSRYRLSTGNRCVQAAIIYYWLARGGVMTATWYDSRYQYVSVYVGDRATSRCGFDAFYRDLEVAFY